MGSVDVPCLQVSKEKCTKEEALNPTLPYTCYLVTYKVDGEERHDLTVAQKAVELFDYYYDLYKKDFITFIQSGGRVNPKLWNNQSTPQKQKPKKKKEE